MSEIESALPDAAFDGLVSIEEAGPYGMLTVKGDLAAPGLQNAVKGIAGVVFPEPQQAVCSDTRGLLWMAPDELLVLTPYDDAPQACAAITQALSGTHHLAANVSDARAVFILRGAMIRDVLAKLTPADLHPDVLAPGTLRCTRLAQVPAAFWLRDQETAELICFRSVAQYVFDILAHAARPGTAPGHF